MNLDRIRLVSASEGLLSAAALDHSWEDALDALARATHSHSACIWSSRKGGRPAYLGNATFTREGVAGINKPGDPPYMDEILISSKSDDVQVALNAPAASRPNQPFTASSFHSESRRSPRAPSGRGKSI